MITNKLIFVLFIACWSSCFGQYTYNYDTLSINHRMLGNLDSTDVRSGILPTTFDGGIGILSQAGFSLNRLNSDFGSQRFNQSSPNYRLKFSALPFIGFSYSFGGQGTQFIRAQYVQAFTDSLVLNINYTGNIGNGYLRNAAFQSNRVDLNLEWKSGWYTLKLNGAYYSDSVNHNGGIATDSLIETFGLIFSPVRKTSASSKNVFGKAVLTNYFHFNPNAQSRFGLLTEHGYDIKYRAYHEFEDSLIHSYDLINTDSTTTYDRSNLARIQNSVGAFFANKNKYIDFQIGHTYWSNLNLGNDFDTTEIDLASNLRWDFGRLVLTNTFKQNIIGGFGAMHEEARIRYTRLKWNVSADLSIDRSAPIPIQRSYFGNNYAYKLDQINLENRLMLGGKAAYKIKGDSVFVGASLNSLAVRNAYIFEDTSWNQVGALNALQIGAFGKFQMGKFHVHPRVIYSIEDGAYLPKLQTYARVYFKSTVFKAKKMVLLIGIDGSYTSAFRPRNFIPSMDAYTWNQDPVLLNGMANAHFFTTIEINTFRFFVRYENIGYFWNNKLFNEYNGFPIASQRIRLGLTWSFFN